MQIIDFSVSNQILSASCPGRLVVSQTRGHLFAQVALDHEWDGLSVTAVFSNDFARKSYQRILTADPVEVPEEVLVPGRLFVSLVGLGDGGAVRLTTKRMDKPIVVYRAGDLVGLTPEETTPELWEQVMSVIGSLDELQTSDKSSLVAAINAVLQSGGGGSVDPDAIAQAVADYMAAHPIQETDPTVPAWAKQPEKPAYTAAEVHALPDTYTPPVDATLTQSGQAADAKATGDALRSLSEEIVTTAASQVSAHNTGADTHRDIRLLIQGLTDRLNALADSDDTTLDQLSEVVAYIKSNRELIDAITTDKVSVADIVNNLTTNVTNKPLSAAQGVAIKALIDAISIPKALPNPNAMTFTGAVDAVYDGSEAVTVNIPEGGSGSYNLPIASATQLGGVMPVAKTDEMTQAVGVDETGGLWSLPPGWSEDLHYQLIADVTSEEAVASFVFDKLGDGSSFSFKRIFIVFHLGSALESAYLRTAITLADGRSITILPPVLGRGNRSGEQLIYVQGRIASSYGYMYYDSSVENTRLGMRKVNAAHNELSIDGSNDIVSFKTWIQFGDGVFPAGTRITVYGA